MPVAIQSHDLIDAGADFVMHICLGIVKSFRKAAANDVIEELDGDFVLDAIVQVLQGMSLLSKC